MGVIEKVWEGVFSQPLSTTIYKSVIVQFDLSLLNLLLNKN